MDMELMALGHLTSMVILMNIWNMLVSKLISALCLGCLVRFLTERRADERYWGLVFFLRLKPLVRNMRPDW